MIVCINNGDTLGEAKKFAAKHSLQKVIHMYGEVPKEYSLRYIPHHVVIGTDGIVKMNYDSPTKNYMSVLDK